MPALCKHAEAQAGVQQRTDAETPSKLLGQGQHICIKHDAAVHDTLLCKSQACFVTT